MWGVSHEKAFKFEKTISGEEGSALDNGGIDIGSKLLAISHDITLFLAAKHGSFCKNKKFETWF